MYTCTNLRGYFDSPTNIVIDMSRLRGLEIMSKPRHLMSHKKSYFYDSCIPTQLRNIKDALKGAWTYSRRQSLESVLRNLTPFHARMGPYGAQLFDLSCGAETRAGIVTASTDAMETRGLEYLFEVLTSLDTLGDVVKYKVVFSAQGFMVTLENPDFASMSPPVREDFAHGHCFCFVLDTDKEAEFSDDTGASDSTADIERSTRDNNEDEYVLRSQLSRLINAEDVNMGVFGTVPDEDSVGDGSAHGMRGDEELQVEAYNTFMRLQLVRQKAVSLNNAIIVMRDSKGELSAAFEWLDICTDTLNSAKIDRKKVKDLQGSMYTPASQTVRQVMVLPESISDLSLKVIDNAIGRVTDTESRGKGKTLFA
ncbi:hypothetical protein Q5P01_016582 [Channa striata]|uniref:Uncharacterized protein n=1 Tax=Channa striata TaxID=64152 RepID=A0AA88M833_CHASR|nr:hypothetical protein Q5P01_016582 [Channa striata]